MCFFLIIYVFLTPDNYAIINYENVIDRNYAITNYQKYLKQKKKMKSRGCFCILNSLESKTKMYKR